MFKRGQEIETVWAFGMALVIIAATVAVIANYNLLSPKQYIETSCSISPRIKCTDYKINTTGHGTVKIENKLGEDILNVRLKVGDCDEATTIIIRDQRDKYLNFQNCGLFSENQRIDKKIDLTYQVFGNSFIFDLSGNLLADVESGLTWIVEEVIIPIIKQILVAPECTYLTQPFLQSSYVATIGRDDAATWKTTDTFYVKDPATQNLVTFGLDCIIPFGTRVTDPAYCDVGPFGSDAVYTKTATLQTYATGTPAGILGCCSKGINPVRGDIKTFRVGEAGYLSSDVKDLYIDETHPTSTRDNDVLEVSKKSSSGFTNATLLQWNINSIPTTAKIRNVTIMLTTTGYTARVQGGQITLYKMVTTDWTTSASWKWKYKFILTYYWASGSAGTFSIQDYDSGAPLRTITIPCSPSCTNKAFNITGQEIINYVQSSLGSRVNFVLMHDTDNTPLQMYSSADPTVIGSVYPNRPKLFIEYEDKSGGQHFCPAASTTTSSTTTTTVLGNLDNQEVTPEYEIIQEYPASFGNIVVWQQYDINKNNHDIFLCNITKNGQNEGCLAGDAKRQVTSIAGNQTRPAIYGKWIVWEEDIDNFMDIYLCDLTLSQGTDMACYSGDKKTKLTTIFNGVKPKIWGNSTSNDPSQTKIVWQSLGGSAIFLCKFAGAVNCNSPTTITHNLDDSRCSMVGANCKVYNPDISGNNIVWESHVFQGSEIYRCDASSSCTPGNRIAVETGAGPNENPKVHGNSIVWRSGTNLIRRCSIGVNCVTGGGTPVTDLISDYQSEKRNPEIYGNVIAWAQQPPGQSTGNFDIYKCSINTTNSGTGTPEPNGGCNYNNGITGNNRIRVTSDLDNQLFPEIYARFIIWQDYRNVNADIYMSNKSKLQ